jgi:hypothetical protein
MGHHQVTVSWHPEDGAYLAVMRMEGGTAVGRGATVGEALRSLAGVVDAAEQGLVGATWREADEASLTMVREALARQQAQIRQDVEDLEP